MEHGKCQTPHGSGHMPPNPARVCTVSPGKAVSSTHPTDATDGNSLGARAKGDFLVCCASCTWLFFSCEKDSQRGKETPEEIQQVQLCSESSAPPAACSIGTGTLQRVWWPWVLTKISLHHPGNLADVPGAMMVFYPSKFSFQKRLTCSIRDK